MTDWETWWDNEGSAIRPTDTEDVEEFARRITAIAWANGAYKAHINLAKQIEAMPFGDTAASFAVWIREQA